MLINKDCLLRPWCRCTLQVSFVDINNACLKNHQLVMEQVMWVHVVRTQSLQIVWSIKFKVPLFCEVLLSDIELQFAYSKGILVWKTTM
jgi:hypothetical protein